MKSYLHGLITGAVFVFALMVLIGSTDNDSEVGRYGISLANMGATSTMAESIIDTRTGEVVSRNQLHIKKFKKIK